MDNMYFLEIKMEKFGKLFILLPIIIIVRIWDWKTTRNLRVIEAH